MLPSTIYSKCWFCLFHYYQDDEQLTASFHLLLLHSVCWLLCHPQAAETVLSQLKRLARALWSNPPTHGARIAAEVVGDADMFELWKSEVRKWQVPLHQQEHLPPV